MEFIWSDSGDTSIAEKEVWRNLKLAIADEDGICYHRFPILSADRSRKEPDILIMHKTLGLFVINCKGYKIENIESIDGKTWKLRDWESSAESPIAQAEDQIWIVTGKFKSESDLRVGRKDLIQGHVFLGLPFVTRDEWRKKDFQVPHNISGIIFAEDLEPLKLKTIIHEVPPEEKQDTLTDEQWKLALSVLQGVPVLRRPLRPEPSDPKAKAYFLRQVEQQMMSIDREQSKVAIQIPSGPQRIRGLSGSGKTVVMCMKAAWMHSRFPDWDIAYTFYTRSLYGMIRNLITRFYRYWVDEDPNWDKIHIMHGWGAKDTPGLYRTVAEKMGKEPRSYTEARNLFFHKQQNELLGKCCDELLNYGNVPELFDAVLIDEGQDFNFKFYRLCLNILREPKRLIWAYDEVQSLETLNIPTTIDIFGTNEDGSPIVNLDGSYPDGEVEKDIILYHCYRTPRPVLVTAHIFGMGLLRPQGAVQFIPNKGGWEDIGYEIVSGSFVPGKELTIRRPEANSPHILEKLVGYRGLVQCQGFDDRESELTWVANQIAVNINKDELKPEEIMVISLDWKNNRINIPILEKKLLDLNIKSIRPGTDTDSDVFQVKDNVTITGIYPAKGNEASVVYVIGFEKVGMNPALIVQERNQAFTAMTRTKGWCILTGIGKEAQMLFKEISNILSNPEQITFKVPDKKTIQRNLDSLEYERRRNNMKKADELTYKLRQVLAEIDDPQIRKQIMNKIENDLNKLT
jgi:superfamily I DNA and RNA helicase